jgi:2-polyprenyl-6-methoxyphenol hydroxylase-like FAD-dependent oxidoreductase
MRSVFDAVIVGAGPAGSSAAILLARAGWSVALVEKQRFPRRKVCGECIAASNLSLLDALGIGPVFDSVAGPELRKVALMRGDQTIIADMPESPDGKYRWGRALGRETLDTLLIERARDVGVLVLQPCSVQAIEGEVGNWHCAVRTAFSKTTLTLHTPVAIDAHGSWESLPSSRLHSRESRSVSNLFAFKANFRDTSLDEGLLPILSFDGGYGGMAVADGGVTTLAGCIRSDYLGAYRRASPRLRAGEVVEALLNNQCKGVRMALQGASREGAWLAVGPLDPGIRLGAVDDPFRIGNAAGEAHPIIGEGMSMALQSSWLLCGHLLGTDQPQSIASKVWQREVGRRYAVEWRHHFESRLRLAAAFAHLAMRPVFSAPLVALARAWPAILTVGAKWGGKVRCAADLALIDRLTPIAGGAAESGGVPFRDARQSGLTWH